VSQSPDYSPITEFAGDDASREQLRRVYQRYYWAGRYVAGKDALEIACGVGQGLGYLASLAKTLRAGDISEQVLGAARRHYGGRLHLQEFSAESLPFADASFDVVLIFEAIYYVKDVGRFISEGRRVLRAGGCLLIVSANKDLFDFSPSPYSVRYYGVPELQEMLESAGFSVAFFGDTPIASVSAWQRMLRPVKRIAAVTGLMPKSKRMKAIVKRLVFGPAEKLPAEIQTGGDPGPALVSIPSGVPDRGHKVVFCEATLAPR